MILDQKHLRFQKLCRQFAETEFTKELLDRLDETGEFDWDIFNKMSRYGFCGVKIMRVGTWRAPLASSIGCAMVVKDR